MFLLFGTQIFLSPKNKKYELGEDDFIQPALVDEPEKIPINGRVV